MDFQQILKWVRSQFSKGDRRVPSRINITLTNGKEKEREEDGRGFSSGLVKQRRHGVGVFDCSPLNWTDEEEDGEGYRQRPRGSRANRGITTDSFIALCSASLL